MRTNFSAYEQINPPKNENFTKGQQIQFDIELKIIMGAYKPGELVPSVRSLAKMYNIGTSTSQSILEKLSRESILVMEQGIGFKVNYKADKMLIKKHRKCVEETFRYAVSYARILKMNPEELI